MIQPLSYTGAKITAPMMSQVPSATLVNDLKDNITALVTSPDINRIKKTHHPYADNQVLLQETGSIFERKSKELGKLNEINHQLLTPPEIKNKALGLGQIKDEVDANKHIKEAIDSILVINIAELKCFALNYSLNPEYSIDIYEKSHDLLYSVTTRLGKDLTNFKWQYNDFKESFVCYINLNRPYSKMIPDNSPPAKLFFEELQKAFDNTETAEKYLIAAGAAKLLQMWRFIPPKNNDKIMIGDIADTHKELIAIGNALTPHHFLIQDKFNNYVVRNYNE